MLTFIIPSSSKSSPAALWLAPIIKSMALTYIYASPSVLSSCIMNDLEEAAVTIKLWQFHSMFLDVSCVISSSPHRGNNVRCHVEEKSWEPLRCLCLFVRLTPTWNRVLFHQPDRRSPVESNWTPLHKLTTNQLLGRMHVYSGVAFVPEKSGLAQTRWINCRLKPQK